MTGGAVQGEILQLLWICGGKAERATARWRQGLGPEIGMVTIEPTRPILAPGPADAMALAAELADTCRAALDDRPYAIAGYGPWALTGFALAGLLPAAPMHLMVAGSAAPPAVTSAVSCTVTAFAADGGAAADDICRWRAVTSGQFCVRLLPDGRRGWFSPGATTLAAIKEDLRVWPR
jgi:hypothetical protein